MIDFDKKFQNYFEKWTIDNAGKYTYDEMEDKIPEIYDMWLAAADNELGGKSVEEFVNAMGCEDLINEFTSAYAEGLEPSTVILDKLESMPECVESLLDILNSDCAVEAKMSTANLLHEMNEAERAINIFVDWIFSYDVEAELKDIAVEILADYADIVKDDILVRVDELTESSTKTLIAEILINAPKDDRTFNLLVELFESKTNVALHAGYLGKYGDERAATTLYKAMDSCNYLEFTEIRNAIEVLGGVVDDDFRDFTDDEYYKAIKNLK